MTDGSVGSMLGLAPMEARRRASVMLVVLIACLGVCAPASAHAIPEGSSLWFACTEAEFSGPHSLSCPQAYNPLYLRTFLGGFTRFTPENEFEMQYLEPQQNRFSFTLADEIARFAVSNHLTIRGHSLLWWGEEPWWLTHPLLGWSPASLTDAMSRYISTVVGHFASTFPHVVTEWDVVNEPVDANGNLIRSVWEKVLGANYISTALQDAHDADPSADLVVNDEGSGAPGPETTGMLNLATHLKAEGAPLDTVGFEAHVTPDTAATLPELVSLFGEFAVIGVNVEVTELDVADDAGVDDPADKQAVFETYAEACQAAPNCSGYTVWGVADQYSWINAKTSDALLYTDAFAPTAAVSAVQSDLAGGRPAPVTSRASTVRACAKRKGEKRCPKRKAAT